MTGDDVHHDDMSERSEHGADGALGAFFDDVRSAAAALPAPVPDELLLALFEHGTMPLAPAPLAPIRPRRWGLRVAVAGAVGGLVFGGLGVAGALPATVQERVSEVVDVVGVHLPDGHPATTVPPTTPVGPRPAQAPGHRSSSTTTTVGDDRGRPSGDDGPTDGTEDNTGSGSGGRVDEGSGRDGTTTTLGDQGEDDSSGRASADDDHGGSGSPSGSGDNRSTGSGGPPDSRSGSRGGAEAKDYTTGTSRPTRPGGDLGRKADTLGDAADTATVPFP